MRRRPASFAALIFFLAAAAYYGITEPNHGEKKTDPQAAREKLAIVAAVSDGDTLTIVTGRGELKIRLIGIDAPELGQKPWGARSRKQLEQLVAGSMQKVRIEYDAEERDKYGRVLAYVFAQDGTLINEDMLGSGLAVLYTFPPNVKYVDRFTAAQKRAQESRKGIWGPGGLGQTPSAYRKEHPRR